MKLVVDFTNQLQVLTNAYDDYYHLNPSTESSIKFLNFYKALFCKFTCVQKSKEKMNFNSIQREYDKYLIDIYILNMKWYRFSISYPYLKHKFYELSNGQKNLKGKF